MIDSFDIESVTGSLAVLSFATMQIRDIHAVHPGLPPYALQIPWHTIVLHQTCNVCWLVFGYVTGNLYVVVANVVYAAIILFLCWSPKVVVTTCASCAS